MRELPNQSIDFIDSYAPKTHAERSATEMERHSSMRLPCFVAGFVLCLFFLTPHWIKDGPFAPVGSWTSPDEISAPVPSLMVILLLSVCFATGLRAVVVSLSGNLGPRELSHPVRTAGIVVLLLDAVVVASLIFLLPPVTVEARRFWPRSTWPAWGCAHNLADIHEAKRRWAIANNKNPGDPVNVQEVTDLLDPRWSHRCPDRGKYTYNEIGVFPSCSTLNAPRYKKRLSLFVWKWSHYGKHKYPREGALPNKPSY